MKVSINNLEEFAERHYQGPPFFANREFNMIMTATRDFAKRMRITGETPKQARQRVLNKMALDSAISKLRTLTREI